MSNRQKTESELIFNALVGNNIKYLRKKHKLTQTDVGKAINVTFQQIGKYEQGKNGVHAFNLQKIAKNVFKVSMDVLVDPQMIAKHIGFSDYMNEVEDQQLTPQDAGYLKPQKGIGSYEEIKGRLKKDAIDWTEGFNDDDDNVKMSDEEHLNRQLRK
tara:strand:- start:370 stop:840 length:471 start_codon:yes stop_codon:yes gene_type:complete